MPNPRTPRRIVNAPAGWLRTVCRSLLLIALLGTNSAVAGDWPQILGPHRTGQADGEELQAWNDGGPPLVWSYPVGEGFAGPAVVGQRVIVFHRQGSELVAECLDAATGKPRWRTTFETRYRASISPDAGPRCVPLVHGERVYLFGPGGELACVALDSGRKLWLRNVQQEFDAPDGYFGSGSCPIVVDDKLLLNVGGREAGIVAFALDDGKTLWKATGEAASYSSPAVTMIDGQPTVLFVTRLSVVGLDPRDGAVRFQFPFGARGPTVNAATPLVLGDHLFVSASYGVGARWVELAADEANPIWESDQVMSSQYTTCVAHDGVLYGIDGRQDIGVARLRAFDPRTQQVYWTEENFGTGNLILVGDKLLIVKTDGGLVLAEATPREYRLLAEAKLFDTTVQALPALSAGRLFARDTQALKCFAVGKPAVAGP